MPNRLLGLDTTSQSSQLTTLGFALYLAILISGIRARESDVILGLFLNSMLNASALGNLLNLLTKPTISLKTALYGFFKVYSF